MKSAGGCIYAAKLLLLRNSLSPKSINRRERNKVKREAAASFPQSFFLPISRFFLPFCRRRSFPKRTDERKTREKKEIICILRTSHQHWRRRRWRRRGALKRWWRRRPEALCSLPLLPHTAFFTSSQRGEKHSSSNSFNFFT